MYNIKPSSISTVRMTSLVPSRLPKKVIDLLTLDFTNSVVVVTGKCCRECLLLLQTPGYTLHLRTSVYNPFVNAAIVGLDIFVGCIFN